MGISVVRILVLLAFLERHGVVSYDTKIEQSPSANVF